MKTKPDLKNEMYNLIFDFLIEENGPKNIVYHKDYNSIEVNLSNLSYFLTLSYNETKIYFDFLHPKISEKLSYEDFKRFKSFRVFKIEEAKKYIQFKTSENELISNISG